MRKLTMLLILPIFLFSACKQKVTESTNPFFSEYNTPFGVPPFDKIDTSHFMPAIEKGIIDQQAEIDAIVNNAEAPTFENTIY